MSLLEKIGEIVRHDIDPDFIKTFAISMGWGYADLYESLAAEQEDMGEAYCLEEFARRRGYCAIRNLVAAAKQHGIPFDFRYLPCNGQHKLLVKVGRVILIQEPILSLDDDPRTSEYKRELAESHGLIRQLELDLGDRLLKTNEWSGCILGVILHGAAGPQFSREHRNLGALMLAVPDGSYNNWVMRADLLSMAMEGRGLETGRANKQDSTSQPDKVQVSVKRRNINRENSA